MPVSPNVAYRNHGWRGWGDWLGTGRIANQDRQFRPFAEARKFARSLGFTNQAQWFAFAKGDKRPDDVPANPYQEYTDEGWISWGDWLGSGNVAPWKIESREFGPAREFARGLKLASRDEWLRFCDRELPEKGELPTDIPSYPDSKYKGDGWEGWADWLGTDNYAPGSKVYRGFPEAREFARGLKLASRDEWYRFCADKLPEKGARPRDIPANPSSFYRDTGWNGWRDWLGKANLPFQDARDFARKLRLENRRQWREYCQRELPARGNRPDNIPSSPERTYKGKGWISWPDWLGTDTNIPGGE